MKKQIIVIISVVLVILSLGFSIVLILPKQDSYSASSLCTATCKECRGTGYVKGECEGTLIIGPNRRVECPCGKSQVSELTRTCKECGEKTIERYGKCAWCGYNAELSSFEHNTVEKKCSNCNGTGKAPHNFEMKSEIGVHWEECTVCHEIRNKVAHTLSIKYNDRYHWIECSVCGIEVSKEKHDYSEIVCECGRPYFTRAY